MSTCNWLDLQTLGSQPNIMPKNLPNHSSPAIFSSFLFALVNTLATSNTRRKFKSWSKCSPLMNILWTQLVLYYGHFSWSIIAPVLRNILHNQQIWTWRRQQYKPIIWVEFSWSFMNRPCKWKYDQVWLFVISWITWCHKFLPGPPIWILH